MRIEAGFAILYTGSPDGLINGLQKLESWSQRIPMDASPSTANMFIIKPFSGSAFMKLFSTHPPTEERIAAAASSVCPTVDCKNWRRCTIESWVKAGCLQRCRFSSCRPASPPGKPGGVERFGSRLYAISMLLEENGERCPSPWNLPEVASVWEYVPRRASRRKPDVLRRAALVPAAGPPPIGGRAAR